MLTIPWDFSSNLFEKRLATLEHKDSVMGKATFHASVASEAKTSNNCSSNKEGTINTIVRSFFIRR